MSRPELYCSLFDAYVSDYGAFATHESEPTAAHDSQSKDDSKVAEGSRRIFRKGKFWQEVRHDFGSSADAGRSQSEGTGWAGSGRIYGAGFCFYRLRYQ